MFSLIDRNRGQGKCLPTDMKVPAGRYLSGNSYLLSDAKPPIGDAFAAAGLGSGLAEEENLEALIESVANITRVIRMILVFIIFLIFNDICLLSFGVCGCGSSTFSRLNLLLSA